MSHVDANANANNNAEKETHHHLLHMMGNNNNEEDADDDAFVKEVIAEVVEEEETNTADKANHNKEEEEEQQQWNAVLKLVVAGTANDIHNPDLLLVLVDNLKSQLSQAGITNAKDLELFGDGAACFGTADPFAHILSSSSSSSNVPPIIRRKLYVVATYLLNDGPSIMDGEDDDTKTLASMARFNKQKLHNSVAAAVGSTEKTTAAPTSNGKQGVKRKATSTVKHTNNNNNNTAKRPTRGSPRGKPPKSSNTNTPKKAAAVAAAAKKKTVRKELYRGPPMDDFVETWPPGWIKVTLQRIRTTSTDDDDENTTPKTIVKIENEWISPGGKRLRSKLDVLRFLKALEQIEKDKDSNKEVEDKEEAAFKKIRSIVLEEDIVNATRKMMQKEIAHHSPTIIKGKKGAKRDVADDPVPI